MYEECMESFEGLIERKCPNYSNAFFTELTCKVDKFSYLYHFHSF